MLNNNNVNNVNLNNELNNSGNLNNDFDLYEKLLSHQVFGICIKCNKPNSHYYWCKDCYSKKFQQNFGNWTSKNVYVDNFIRELQLKARNRFELLEWVPYDRLRNIKFLAQGGFSTVYEAIWLDGLIDSWDYRKNVWKREVDELNVSHEDSNNSKIKNPLKSNEKYGYYVVLKSLNDSSNMNDHFLNEWRLHLECQYKVASSGSTLAPLIGITQDPETLNYMIVMAKLPFGSLRDNLLIKRYNPNDKFHNLLLISTQLEAIHKLNLVHGDFHSGNLLCHDHELITISDLGLCRLVNHDYHKKNEIYGILPYMAPEVLRGKSYTKAADIYSFGIIMWEMTSGIPAFHNVPHDLSLSLNVCRGIRPEIMEGTNPEYAELMKRCWDNDPEKRPTANELKRIFLKWAEIYPMEEDEKNRKPVPKNETDVECYQKSYYTSRKIQHSDRLNAIFAQIELSNKIIINENNGNHDNEIIMSDNLADCVIEG
ncbi:kinase-like domain-containing protein [Rhizophagus clarus]|uniref:Kinase-like domain-containing protein n=1 Tax=Rhizophagus clarus TaxID=94130 RepID=A0A8H3LDF6_9GLOM|nr:kinase-like domain-containing protein [Rhizophagus clarus]